MIAPSEKERKVPNEAILNVFRLSDERVLKKKEIAEELPIEKKQVGNRLEDLEEDGRVHRRELGPSHIWWLDESEPTHPVRTRSNTLVWLGVHFRGTAKFILYVVGALALMTVLLVSGYVVIGIYPPLGSVVSQEQATTGAFLSAIFAVVYLIVGSILILVARGLLWRARRT